MGYIVQWTCQPCDPYISLISFHKVTASQSSREARLFITIGDRGDGDIPTQSNTVFISYIVNSFLYLLFIHSLHRVIGVATNSSPGTRTRGGSPAERLYGVSWGSLSSVVGGSGVSTGKILTENFDWKNDWKPGNAISSHLSTFVPRLPPFHCTCRA